MKSPIAIHAGLYCAIWGLVSDGTLGSSVAIRKGSSPFSPTIKFSAERRLLLEDFLNQAQAQHKPLLVFMNKEGCPHCAKFESEMLKPNSDFLRASFVCARILSGSADARHLESDFRCHAYPHFIVFREDGSTADRWYGQPESAAKFKADAMAKLQLAEKQSGER